MAREWRFQWWIRASVLAAALVSAACPPARSRDRDEEPAGCADGELTCGGACVDPETDEAHCGRCGRACAAGVACESGRCGGLPADCRTDECPLLTYCDLADGRCRPGCALDTDCPQPGGCDLGTRTCGCAAGHHLCGTACVPDASPATCGARCDACPAPANAVATCDGTSCGFRCAEGLHACDGACVTDDSPATCGTRCEPCPGVANGEPACVEGACAIRCDPGFHECNGACVRDDSPATCGTRCTACPSGPGATAVCRDGACGLECATGFHACGASCVSDTSTQGCGESCAVCSAPAGALPACVSGQCVFTCPGTKTVKFGAPATYPAGASPYGIAAGDFNGDGRADLATVHYTSPAGLVKVFAGNGAGGLGAPTQEFAGRYAISLATGDLDLDGFPDVVTADAYGNSVTVLLSRGDGTFRPKTTYAQAAGVQSGPQGVAIGELTGDELPDIAVANTSSNSVTILRNTGAGRFVFYELLDDTGAYPKSVAIGDVDGNGHADVVTANHSGGSVSIYLRRTPGSTGAQFQPALALNAGTTPHALVLADFDRDGDLDAAFANEDANEVSLIENAGAFVFSPQPFRFAVGPKPRSLTAADFDGDGRLDLVSTNHDTNTVSVLRGSGLTGANTFRAQATYTVGTRPMAVAAVDLNRDGIQDLAVTLYNTESIAVMLGACL